VLIIDVVKTFHTALRII